MRVNKLTIYAETDVIVIQIEDDNGISTQLVNRTDGPGGDLSSHPETFIEITVASIWLWKVHLYLRRGFEKPNVALEEGS